MKMRPSSTSLEQDHHLTLSRRQFLYWGAAFTAGLALPGSLQAAIAPDEAEVPREQRLILFNLHTHEKLDICYARGGAYHPQALTAINNILRDHRANKVHPIDTRLLDLLCAIRSHVGPDACLHIVSGYRSPQTNQMLRRRSHRVARKSLHMKGHAADIRIPGLSTKKLRKIAIGLRQGGVGYYPRSRFVHVDIGQVRTW